LFGRKSKSKSKQQEARHPAALEAAELAISNIAEETSEITKAKAMVSEDLLTQAEFLLETLLKKHPNNCDLWHAIGHVQRLLNRFDEAKESYSQAIDIAYRYHSIIHFEHSACCLQRALLLFAMGQAEKAKRDIEQAIFQDHNNHVALYVQQNGWQAGEELPRYESNLMTEIACEQELQRRRLDLDDLLPHQKAHDKAIYFRRQHQLERALSILNETLEQHPHYGLAWHHRALLLLEMGEAEPAFHAIEQAIIAGEKRHQHYHHNAALHHYHRGQLHHQMSEPEMAIIDLKKAIDINKNMAEAHVALAQLHYETGQYPTAITDIEKALAITPNPKWETLKQQWLRKIKG